MLDCWKYGLAQLGPMGITMPLVRLGALMAMGFTLAGCQAALWGNVFVFAVSVGIFMGTLSLGRRS